MKKEGKEIKVDQVIIEKKEAPIELTDEQIAEKLKAKQDLDAKLDRLKGLGEGFKTVIEAIAILAGKVIIQDKKIAKLEDDIKKLKPKSKKPKKELKDK